MEIKTIHNQIYLTDITKAHGYEVEVYFTNDEGKRDTEYVGVSATNRTQAASLVKKHAFDLIAGSDHLVASVNMTS